MATRDPVHAVQYELTLNDLYAFQWRALQIPPTAGRLRRNRYVSVLLIALGITTLPALLSGYPVLTWLNVILFIVLVSVLTPVAGLIERHLSRSAIRDFVRREKPGKGQLGRHMVALYDDAVVETTATGEMRTTWAGVDRVEQDDNYIFIYTSAASAHVIPKRAFSGDAAGEFFRFAEHARSLETQLDWATRPARR